MPKEGNSTEHVINASEFRRNFSRYLRNVAESGDELIITKFGQPLVKLVPYHNPHSIVGMFKDDIRILGDIVEPLDVEWEAMQDSTAEHDMD